MTVGRLLKCPSTEEMDCSVLGSRRRADCCADDGGQVIAFSCCLRRVSGLSGPPSDGPRRVPSSSWSCRTGSKFIKILNSFDNCRDDYPY